MTERKVGRGRVVWGGATTGPAARTSCIRPMPPPWRCSGSGEWRRCSNRQARCDGTSGGPMRATSFFVSNRQGQPVETSGLFRTDGAAPELWNPVDGTRRPLPAFAVKGEQVEVPLRFAAHESYFVVFNRHDPPRAARAAGREELCRPKPPPP